MTHSPYPSKSPDSPDDSPDNRGRNRSTTRRSGLPGQAPEALAASIRGCRVCVDAPLGPPLPHAPRPILVLSSRARLVIASQAPGNRAHVSGVPFDDASGTRLRDWMGIGPALFYDPDRVMIAPMGFCFPGYDLNKGDRPPRRECQRAWHKAVFAALPQVETILAVGVHAIRYHLARLHPELPLDRGLGEHVRDWRALVQRPDRPLLIPLPHPSWRNSAWLARNPFFAADLLPVLRAEVRRLVGHDVATTALEPASASPRPTPGSPSATTPGDPR